MRGSTEVMATPCPKGSPISMNLPADINLPATAKELIELIGWDDAHALMRKYGGTYVDVPKNPARATQLSEILSEEGVNKLCAYYSGGRIDYLPKLDKVIKAIRNGQIREDCKTLSRREVALKYNLAIQTINEIAGAGRQTTDHQISLF